MPSRSSSATTSPPPGPSSASTAHPSRGHRLSPTRVSSITEEIKQRVDLVELIGRSVALKRAGGYYRGLCPFHTEKTPSFYVRPDRGTWHCFGCDRSGTAFDWLMEREHLDFPEALRMLAQQTGVTLPERRGP